MADKVRIGIIGAGDIFRSRHFPGLAKVDEAEVVAICNRSKESGQSIAGEFGLSPDIMTDPDALLAREDVDAVMIGTWPYKHCPFVLDSLDAGKHTFVQARMAMNLEEAQLMHDAAQSNPDLVAQIVPSPMTLWADRTIQRLISEGFLGDILSVEVRSAGSDFIDHDGPIHWRNDYDLSGMNIMTMGIWYEAMRRWVGDPLQVFAQAKTFTKMRRDSETGVMRAIRVPQHIDVLMDLICGAQGYLKISTIQGLANENTATIYGSEGTIQMGDGKLYGAQRGDEALSEIKIRPEDHGEWRVEEEFISAIRGKELITHTPFETGVKYMEFTEAARKSANSGERIDLSI